MVRSDRYFWYGSDRAKLYGESREEQHRDDQSPGRAGLRLAAGGCCARKFFKAA